MNIDVQLKLVERLTMILQDAMQSTTNVWLWLWNVMIQPVFCGPNLGLKLDTLFFGFVFYTSIQSLAYSFDFCENRRHTIFIYVHFSLRTAVLEIMKWNITIKAFSISFHILLQNWKNIIENRIINKKIKTLLHL